MTSATGPPSPLSPPLLQCLCANMNTANYRFTQELEHSLSAWGVAVKILSSAVSRGKEFDSRAGIAACLKVNLLSTFSPLS